MLPLQTEDPPKDVKILTEGHQGPGICASKPFRFICAKPFRFICAVVLVGFAVSVAVILLKLGSSEASSASTGDLLASLPCDDAFEPAIDAHVNELVNSIIAGGGMATGVTEWAGQNLWAQGYIGMMRSPGGVLADRMGNDLDRCRTVREMLTAVNVKSCYVLVGSWCGVEIYEGGSPTVKISFSLFYSYVLPFLWGSLV